MNFCIATLEYFNSIGFDTSTWRKSIDGIKAIAHASFIEIIIPNIKSNVNIQVYTSPSIELDNLLNSSEWKIVELD